MLTNSDTLRGNGTYNIRKSFTVGKFTPGTSTVAFMGSGSQTIPSTTYYNLRTDTGGTKTAGGALIVNGDLTIGASTTFDANGYTDTIYGNWTNSWTFKASGNTIVFAGGNSTTITGATTFYSMTVNKNDSTISVTLNNSDTVSTINMTRGYLNTGADSVTISTTRTGNGIILGTITRTHTFLKDTSYAFESPYNTVTFSTVGSVTSVTVNVVLTAPGDFPFGGSTNRTYHNYVTGSGYTATLRLHYVDAGLNNNDPMTMALWRYNGSSWTSQGKSANDTTYHWVELNNIADITNRWCLSDDHNVVRWNGKTSSAWETAGNWTAIQGSPSRPPGANDVVEIGDTNFVNQPTITSAINVKSLRFDSVKVATLTLGSGGSLSTAGNIDGHWVANGSDTIAVGAQTLSVGGDLILSDGTANHTIGLTVSTGTVTVTGSLTESGGANITFSGAGTLNIGTDFHYTSGTFAASASTVKYNGGASQAVAGLTYYNLAVDKTGGTASTSSAVMVGGALTLSTSATLSLGASLTVTGDVNINTGTILQANSSAISLGGNWNNAGTFSVVADTVTFNGTGPQAIAATPFSSLVINKSSDTASLSGNITVSGNLAVSSGTLNLAGYTANRSPAGGTLTLNSGTLMRLSGSNNFPVNYSTYSFNSTSTVEYYGSGTQAVGAVTYGNLTLTNGGANAKSLSGATVCAGNLLIKSGATLGGGAASLNVQGNWTNSGSFSAGTGTVTLSGSGKTLTGATTFNNLTVTGSCTASSDITVTGLMNISGGTYAAGSTTTTFSGNFTNSGSFTSSGTAIFSGTLTNSGAFTSTGTVNYAGTSAQAIVPLSYYNLSLTNAGAKTFASGTTSIAGTFSVSGGAVDDTTNFSTIVYNGSSQQTTPAFTYYALTISNSSGIVISGNIAINNTLTFTSGNITTNAYKVSVASSGSVSRTSGYVVGNLELPFSAGTPTRTFDIGSASGYTPALVSFTGISSSGTLTGSTTASDHPQVNSSIIDPTKSVNRYWMLTNSGIAFSTYSATFTFLPTDLDAGVDPTTTDFIVDKYNGSMWSEPTMGTITSTSAQITGVTSLSDFAAGVAKIGQVITSITTGSWNTAGSWDLARIPRLRDSVVIANSYTVTLATNTTATTLTINSGGILADGGTTFTLLGRFILNGTWSGNGTIVWQNSGDTLSGNGSAGSSSTLEVRGNKIIANTSSSFTLSTIYINGAYSMTNSDTISVASVTGSGASSTWTNGTNSLLRVSSALLSTGTLNASATGNKVEYNGGGTQSIKVPATAYYHLSVSNTGAKSPTTDINVNGDFAVANGSTFTGGSFTHTFGGFFTNNGTVTSAGGTLSFAPASPATITLLGTAFSSTGEVDFSGSGLLTIAGSSPTLNDVTISNTNTSGVTLPSGWTIGGDLIIQGGSTLNGGSGSYSIAGSITDDGTFAGGTSTITLTGNNTAILGSGATTFNNLTIPTVDTISLGSNFDISGNFVNNGMLDAAGSGDTVTFTGNSSSTISGTSSPTHFDILVIAKTGATVALNVDLDSLSSLTVSSGTFDLATHKVDTCSSGGSMIINAGATMKVSGASNFPAFSDYSLDATSTVEYNGSGAQAVAFSPVYGNLVFSNTGAKSITASTTAAGNVTIGSGTAVSVAGGVTLRVTGSFTHTGALTNNGTVTVGP